MGVPTVPYSTVSSFSGNCSFFSALPSPFVYTCVPLCVVVMKGGGEKRVGLGMSSMALSRSEASPELK